MRSNRPDIRPELGLRQVINVSGTMTSLGASIVVPEAVETREPRSCPSSSRSAISTARPRP